MSDMRRTIGQFARWPDRRKPLSFGAAILKGRTDKQLLQKDVAAAIEKQDGVAMSASYLNDIERDRRNPPNAHIIRQLASALDLDEDYLFFLAGRIPPNILELSRDQASISQAVKTLRRTLELNSGREADDGARQDEDRLAAKPGATCSRPCCPVFA